jgi:hypothetical protein
MNKHLLATAIRGDEPKAPIILPFCYFALVTHSCSLPGATHLRSIIRRAAKSAAGGTITQYELVLQYQRKSPACLDVDRVAASE